MNTNGFTCALTPLKYTTIIYTAHTSSSLKYTICTENNMNNQQEIQQFIATCTVQFIFVEKKFNISIEVLRINIHNELPMYQQETKSLFWL